MVSHGLVYFRWHRPQVLADDYRLVTMRFKAEDRVKLVRWIAHVSPFAGRTSFRNPIQPMKPHDVINAKQTRVPHLESQKIEQITVMILSHRLRVKRRRSEE